MVDGSDERDRTLWCGNLDNRVTDEILYDLFIQAGPLEKVRIATDRETQKKKGFAFITFRHVVSVPYTIDLMNGMQLFDRGLRLQTRPGSIHETAQRDSMGGGSPIIQGGLNPFMHRSFSDPSVLGGGPGMGGGAVEPEPRATEYQRDRNHRKDGHERRPSHEGHRERSSDRGRDRSRDRDMRGEQSRVHRVESEPAVPPSLFGLPMAHQQHAAAASHMLPQQRGRSGRDVDYRHTGGSPMFDRETLMAQADRMLDFNRRRNPQHQRSNSGGQSQQWHQGGYGGKY